MSGLENVGVFQRGRSQAVVVVRNVHLLLADQFPVVAIRSTIEQVAVVRSAHAVRRGTWPIIGNLRCTSHTTLTGVVDPGQTRLLDLIDGFMQ
ncbi:hypothetical protein D3C78_1066310 [compost metagenome]